MYANINPQIKLSISFTFTNLTKNGGISACMQPNIFLLYAKMWIKTCTPKLNCPLKLQWI